MNTAIILMAVVLGTFIYWGNAFDFSAWMPASGEKVLLEKQYWRLWSSLFVHSDLGHLVSNSFLFFILGSVLNNYFGTLVFPLMAIFMGGLTNWYVLHDMSPEINLVGASGIVFWMGGFWLVLYLMLDRRRTLSQRLLRSLGVAIALFMPMEAFDPKISYQSHFAGFILGNFSGAIYFLLRRRTFRNAEVFEVIKEEEEPELGVLQ